MSILSKSFGKLASVGPIVSGGVIITIVLIAIYIFIKKNIEQNVKTELPDEYEDEAYTKAEGQTIRSIANAVADDLKGLNMSHDEKLYIRFRELNDKLFIGVCNDYKRVTGESMRTALTGDRYSFYGIGQNIKSYKLILSRIDDLNVV